MSADILRLAIQRVNERHRALMAKLHRDGVSDVVANALVEQHTAVVQELVLVMWDVYAVEQDPLLPAVDIANRPDLWPAWVQVAVGDAYDRGVAAQ